jgi:hypothetical protein
MLPYRFQLIGAGEHEAFKNALETEMELDNRY